MRRYTPAMRFALSVLIVLSFALVAHAERTVVNPPIEVLTYKKDKAEIAGNIVAYDDDNFDVKDSNEKITSVAWKDLDAKNNFEIHERLFAKASGAQWLALAQQLIAVPEGKPFAQQALVKAIKLDPAIKAKVEEAVRAMSVKSSPAASGHVEEQRPSDFPVSEPSAPAIASTNKDAWPPLTEGQMAAAVKVNKAFAEAAGKKVNASLVLYETKFFLLYSDMAESEAGRWSELLDRMYGRLAKLFGVQEGTNIWHGKAVIFVFSKAEDFHKFEALIYRNRSRGAIGMCHAIGSDVHINFFRQADELKFAHVLVHESTHGFLHRFRTSIDIPSWANEGLADHVASELVPQPDRAKFVKLLAARELRANGISDLFRSGQISSEQYPVAQQLCEYMIREDTPGYVAFINGIKDGLSAEDALKEKYGETSSRLISNFGESLGVNGVTVGK